MNFLKPIQSQLAEVEKRMRSQADGHHPDLNAALEHLLSSGGKRIRPAIALLTGGMFNGDEQLLIILASSIELLHTATLVHDDLIDGSILRRGIPTLNAQWSPAATVLTGDFIFAKAAELAAETKSVEVMRLFAGTLAKIVNGELTQLFNSTQSAVIENYYARIYAKTASMFELATTAAATLCEVPKEKVESMRKFGYSLGIAFQILDDILDLTGEQTTVGKPVASDLRQGIITLPVIYYHEKHKSDEILRKIIAGKIVEQGLIEELVENIRNSGAIDLAMKDAERFVRDSLNQLADEPESPERNALEELAQYVIRRSL